MYESSGDNFILEEWYKGIVFKLWTAVLYSKQENSDKEIDTDTFKHIIFS